MSACSFDLFDIDGNGIDEILACSSNDSVNLGYSWNGNLYGLWASSPNLNDKKFTVANNLIADVNANVEKNGNFFRYSYTIINSGNSIQKIASFYVQINVDSLINYRFPSGWNGGVWTNHKLFNCFTENKNDLIKPGFLLDSIYYSSTGLPIISLYYMQSLSYNLNNATTDPDSLDQLYFDNLLANSFTGYTISASRPTNPLTAVNFIDTLLSYNQHSLDLGWITNPNTADKYDSLFTLTKTQLQQNNNNAARTTLQTILQQVDIDSTNNLTSEAYALLKYNTEYLLEKIPQSSPNLLVNLKNSLGNQISASNVMYYEGSWKDAVNNGDGTFTVITTRPTVSIRVYYEYASQQVDNVPAQNNTYTFTTVNAAVQLKNSLGNLIDIGTVQYYAGAWRTFGTTSNGAAYKELLPINYSFRMTYEYGSIDKQQNLSVDPRVVFQTVNAAVQLKNSLGNLIDQGTVQYYAGAWRSFGTTSNGAAYKELLPINYSFRMTYEFGSIDKQQNLSVDPTVVFQTVNAAVQLKNSLGNLMPAPMGDAGTVQYYAGAWRTFGTTSNGAAYKELLPINYSFRMIYEYVSKDKQQNLSANPVVDFNTVLCSVKVSKTSNNEPINNAEVKYYAGAWRNLGTTNIDGITTKELLPANLSFRATLGNVSLDKQQDISVNRLVEILLNIP